MKTIYKIYTILFAGILSFTACDDDVDREPSPETVAGCQGVFFPATNASAFELEPSEPTEIILTISRTGTDAVTVPIKADINEQNVFSVPESVSFASGEKSKDIKVTFPNANEGTTYTLKLKVEGDQFVNAYASTTSFVQTSVTRIKWVETQEPGVLVEGIVGTFFGVGSEPFYVQMQKAELGSSTRYRLINPFRLTTKKEPDADGIYDGYRYNDPADMVPGEYMMILTINATGSVSVDPFEMGMDWNYGMFSSGSIYGNVSSNLSSYPLGTLNGDIISFPANSLYCSMANYQNGGKYPAKATTLYLTKQAYLDANSAITDYNTVEYKDEDAAINAFASAAFGEEWDQVLQKAIDPKPDDEDSPYKNLYYLPDLYSDGLGLAFYFNGEKITIPANQPTGVKFLDNDIYVSGSDSLSSGVETNASTGLQTFTLGLNFHLKDGASLGDFNETFFFGKKDIKRTIDDFCGVFTLKATAGYDGSDLEYTVKIAKESDNKTLKIAGLLDPYYANGYGYKDDTVTATFDAASNSVKLSPQALQEKFVYQGIEFDVLFVTYSHAEDQIFNNQSLRIICRYNDVLQFTNDNSNSVAVDGFTYYAVGAGTFDDSPYNVTLTPTGLIEAKSAVLNNKSLTLKNIPFIQDAPLAPGQQIDTQKKTLSFDQFNMQPKSDKKRAVKSNLTPVF